MCGRFTLTAKGKLNTYALFAELVQSLIQPFGRAGIIIPSGIATDDSTKKFFQNVINHGSLHSLFEFENEGFFYGAGQGHMVRFCLFTLTGKKNYIEAAEFLFQGKRVEELEQKERLFRLSKDDILLLNPNTQTMPIFRTRADYELTRKIYQHTPILDNEQTGANPWGCKLVQGLFNMTSASQLFVTNPIENYVPLYESKMFYQFTHRYGDYKLVDGKERKHVLPEIPVNLLEDPSYIVNTFAKIRLI